MSITLETERLILRDWINTDLAPFHRICSDPRVNGLAALSVCADGCKFADCELPEQNSVAEIGSAGENEGQKLFVDVQDRPVRQREQRKPRWWPQMDRFTQQVLPEFDFSEAEALTTVERIDRCILLARELAADYPMYDDIPPVSERGATPGELDAMESDLGVSIPPELRLFWTRCRYLCLDDGVNVGGFDHDGVDVAESVWLSDQHMADRRLLVFGAYWRYADGDQLLIDLDEPTFPVVAYLHEHGPLFERYAPSFSLALWRLVHETED